MTLGKGEKNNLEKVWRIETCAYLCGVKQTQKHNTMTHKITAIAPTSHQLGSLMLFGMGFQKKADGSFTAKKQFDSVEEASDYLRSRAELYCENDRELNDAIDDIVNNGCLTLDAVTAQIEEI